MGEQPIFTTKAHVFQIDPNTKKKWLPASSQSVNVSYYYDTSRDTYRIISVEGSKAVINSTITPNMTFTKTSQKFGQWSDPRANTVYGLGFSSEAECTKFVEKFKEVKELQRQSANKGGSNGVVAPSTPPTTNHVPAPSTPDLTSSVSPLPSPKPATPTQNDNERNTSSVSTNNQVENQLKYENDRLKIALAQSSANAKKWEVELQTLKNNNARLTTALQESTSNVEEWKKQLAMYKEESARMKKKVLEMEKSGGGSELLQRQITELREKIRDMELQNQSKQDEILNLNKRMGEVKSLETKNHDLQHKLQEADKEKAALQRQIAEQRDQLDQSKAQNIRLKQTVRGIQEAFTSKLNDMYEHNDKLAELIQS